MSLRRYSLQGMPYYWAIDPNQVLHLDYVIYRIRKGVAWEVPSSYHFIHNSGFWGIAKKDLFVLDQGPPIFCITGALSIFMISNVPESMMKLYCEKVGMLYESSMLNWEAKPTDLKVSTYFLFLRVE